MPINSFLYPAKHVPGAFEVANSLRFNSGDSPSLSRTSGGSPSSTTKGTFSFWLKRSKLGINDRFVTTNSLSDPYFQMYFDSNASRLDQIRLQCYNGSAGSVLELITNQKFRDNSAWYNIILSYDSTPSTPSSSSIKLFVNGTQVTSFATATYPSQNQNHYFNQGLMRLSGYGASSSDHTDGYMAEVVYCDGQALNADSFGEFDSDSPTIWKPIDVSGLTFGTNGFYLDFEDSSALGNDANGSNDFTVNNLTAIDQSTDTCTNNYATLNPLVNSAITYSEGNLHYKNTHGSNSEFTLATIQEVSNGRWYWEIKMASTNNNSAYEYFGNGTAYVKSNGDIYPSGTTTVSNGDIFGFYLNYEDGQMTIHRNGSQVYQSSSGISLSTTTAQIAAFNNTEYQLNFGNPIFSISSGNADANGYGNFEYSPVLSGVNFYSLCTKNLAEYG